MTVYRKATQAELRVMLGWAAEEGWNPGFEDAAAFYDADPAGFFVALADGEMVAGISVVNHNDNFAFLGLYIVRPAWRGRGIGLALWQHALRHAGQRVVGLDGVPDQQENYARSGFQHAGSTSRFVGKVAGVADPNAVIANANDIPTLIALEGAASGQIKPAYLTAWFKCTEDRKTFVIRDGNVIPALCTVRRCQEGAKIGPFLAEDAVTAEALIRHAATLWPGPVILDVPASSRSLSQLCHALELIPGFETARMYRGPFQPGQGQFFAVTSLELG